MAWKSGNYSEIQSSMKPGDIIAFSGDSIVEEVIKLITNSKVSQTAVIFHPGQLIEAIPNGVKIDNLSRRIETFDGAVWWLPLSDDTRKKMNVKKFYEFLLMKEHMVIGLPQCILRAINLEDENSILYRLANDTKDYPRLFCSELVAAALEESSAISNINAAEVTPGDLCRFSIYEKDYYQIKGQTTIINGFNTISPNGFGE